MHLSQQYEIYRTASECCEAHFKGSSTCLDDSRASHVPYPWPIYQVRGDSPPPGKDSKWYPDLSNKINCVYGKRYDEWMAADGYDTYYLFPSSTKCCDMWYPQRSDCPDTSGEVSSEIEDEAWYMDPYPMNNYYFPDFTASNCGFGRDYPAWMGENGFEKWYLFTRGNECCTREFTRFS